MHRHREAESGLHACLGASLFFFVVVFLIFFYPV